MSNDEFDPDFFAELIDGDIEFGRELIEVFREASLACIALARQAFENQGYEEGIRAFHTLKGSASSVGLVGLQQLSLDCEDLVKAHELLKCKQKLPVVEHEVDKGLKFLQKSIDELGH